MSFLSREFVKDILCNLSRYGNVFLLLKEPKEFSKYDDIDLLVLDLNVAEAMVQKEGFAVIKRDDRNLKAIKYYRSERCWIHLDIWTDVVLSDIALPRDYARHLISKAQMIEGEGFCLSPEDNFFHVILHCCLSNEQKKIDKYLLCKDIEMPVGDFYKLIDIFGNPHFNIDINARDNDASSVNRADIEDFIGSLCLHLKPLRQSQKLSFADKAVRKIFNAFTLKNTVLVLGPDGSGKSTVTEALSDLRWPHVRRRYMGPMSIEEMRNIFTVPLQFLVRFRETSDKRSPMGLAVRSLIIGLQYIDFLERLLRDFWFRGRGGFTAFDRYPCDIYFRSKNTIYETIFIRCFPFPRLVFLCVGDATEIYKRKPEELTIQDIVQMQKLYTWTLNKHQIKFIEIDTVEFCEEEVVLRVVQELHQHMCSE